MIYHRGAITSGLRGWWLLVLLTVIGTILLIVWFCLRGTSGPNRYGPDPLPAE